VTHVNQLPLLLASIITLKLLPCHTSDGRAVPRGKDSAIVNRVHHGRHGMDATAASTRKSSCGSTGLIFNE
jgi:hypothetical protein